MNKYISVSIDGPSGAGKSSLAKRLAKEFSFIYVDTGAIYRTVGLAALWNNIDRKDEKAVSALLPSLNIEMKYNEDGFQCMFLNGEDVSSAIRQPEISICASDVSALPAVRAFLLDMQRNFAKSYNVIMDGRDIGTVVLPNADIKIYLTASAQARAERRMLELQQKGIPADFESVLKDIEYRDYQDSHRETAPLRVPEGAFYVDTSELSFEESFEKMAAIIKDNIKDE